MSLAEEDCNGNIQCCLKLNRIIKTIKLHKNATEKPILPYVMEYKSIVDDFHHILMVHKNQFEPIYDHITKNMEFECDILNCNIFSETEYKSDNTQTIFYNKLLDQIHCHLMHQFDTGSRLRSSLLMNINDTKLNDEGKANDDTKLIAIDQQFEHTSKLLKNRQINLNRISNKFNITSAAVSHTSDNEDQPFIDTISTQMINKGYMKQVQKMIRYLQTNEYDSDALKYDITQGSEKSSNILNNITTTKFALSLNRYVKNYVYRRIYGIFSTGYTFWYWGYYKNNTESTQYQVLTNERAQSFTYSDLYVAAKYANLKTELICNTIYPLDLTRYNITMQKAIKYLEAQEIKLMKSNEKDTSYHYGIRKGTEIQLGHVLSIILYADCTDLSTEFTASFRGIFRNEKLSSIKQRNSEFANWAKLLRECIELYGNKIQKANGMSFYCGMSPLLLPSFLIRLNGPTSTTTSHNIAINFAKKTEKSGSTGIIIELREADVELANSLKYFNSILFSSYPNERERTFMGGKFPLRVYDIKVNFDEEWKTFQKFCQSFFHFEKMITGCDPREIRSATKSDNFIITKLIESLLEDKDIKHLPEYANRLFPFFCNERNVITLKTDSINKVFKKMKYNLFYKGGNMLNLEKVTRIFPNVCTIKINDYQCETNDNKFDVSRFVLCCSDIFNSENNKLKEIILSAQRARDLVSYQYTPSWLYEEYTNIININSTKVMISHHLENDIDVLSCCIFYGFR